MEKEYQQLFVGGDLSGIQKFLYNISSRKAAVSLKGRSYYLRQYMENVCQDIVKTLKEMGAQSVRTIYCSGGKFYLLTENSSQIVQALDEKSKQLKRALWEEHLGQLGLSISYVAYTENPDGSVDCNSLTHQRPGVLWKKVNEDFSKQKSQKFKSFLKDDYHLFFEPLCVGGETKVCAVTGIESPKCRLMDDDKLYVLPSVYQQLLLGIELRNQEHFKTFEEYAGESCLGLLRMDVDNLGKRFIEGFHSIREYEVFSKRLVDFFENEVYKMQQEKEYFDYLNIIYAGGDDLFVVGRWDKIIDFAERIHKETETRFAKDGISISGGIAIVQPKFPIAKGADLAGKSEESAKQFDGGKKNAFNFLGKTVSWDKEFDYVKGYKNQFVNLISSYGLSKGILHKLMLYSSIADMNKVRRKENKAEDFSFVWHISYYLTRYMTRYNSNKAVSDFCRSLRDREIDYKNGRNLELIALAARWAELILKDGLNN